MVAVATLCPIASHAQDASPPVQFVTVDGYRMRVRTSGLQARAAGQPVVVFEAGAMNTLDSWQSVFLAVGGGVPLVAYDRSGLGESSWDGQTPTPRHATAKLRRLLQEVGANPPYVLVGHSWGGSLMRFYAGYYPEEVTGAVYVDPGPLITQSTVDELAPFDAIGAGRAGYDAFWSMYGSLMDRAAPAARAEFDVYRGLMTRDVADRDLQPAPQVPTVVIVAAKPYPPLQGLPFDAQRYFEADLRHRITVLREWALQSEQSALVVSNSTSHAVPREDPELIAWAVKRVLSSVGGK
jgi:pimeloyl-ACP methyl ester carboxylesterase